MRSYRIDGWTFIWLSKLASRTPSINSDVKAWNNDPCKPSAWKRPTTAAGATGRCTNLGDLADEEQVKWINTDRWANRRVVSSHNQAERPPAALVSEDQCDQLKSSQTKKYSMPLTVKSISELQGIYPASSAAAAVSTVKAASDPHNI